MDNEVQGFWSKGEREGGCSNCYQKRERMSVIEIATIKLRFCLPCLQSVAEIARALVEEGVEQESEESGGGD